MSIPRMRVFAGPNGSGKSTLKTIIDTQLLGVYINADDIEQGLRQRGHIDFSGFKVAIRPEALADFLAASPLLKRAGIGNLAEIGLRIEGPRAHILPGSVNAYLAAALAEYLREELLQARESFTFETVMSFPGKIELMHRARDAVTGSTSTTSQHRTRKSTSPAY